MDDFTLERWEGPSFLRKIETLTGPLMKILRVMHLKCISHKKVNNNWSIKRQGIIRTFEFDQFNEYLNLLEKEGERTVTYYT